MRSIMKMAFLFSPLIRLGSSIKRLLSPYTNPLSKLESTNSTYNLSSWNNNAIVQTKYGLISGFSDKGSWCWKGIPYAEPPIGGLRWKAPRCLTPWIGTLKATRFGSSAAQVMPFLGPIGSEDCLYLNIWRPQTPETDLPVYFYIHGGGNSIGSSAEIDYYGNAVSEKSNLLYISVNYRLGAMGWFLHPAVTSTGSPKDKSGNYGTLDLIKALEWVRDNIKAFGGNPNNVTIAGESGGAFNVFSLLVSPSAKGLFHHAITESGLSLIWSTKTAESQSKELLINLFIKDNKVKNREEAEEIITKMSLNEIDDYFRSKSAFKITSSIPAQDFGMRKWCTIFTDGTIIPKEGYDIFSTGNWANKVPLIIGCTKDELKLFGYFRKDPRPGTRNYDLVWGYRSLLWRVSGLDSLVSQMSKNADVPIYAYRFDWGSPDKDGKSVLPKKMGKYLGAHHAAEIPFFLGMGMGAISMITGKTHTRQNQTGREKLTDLCMKYLSNFARTGNPNGINLPKWLVWSNIKDKEKILVLDANHNELNLSYLTDIVTVQVILDLINSELVEPELGEILGYLNEIIPFGIIQYDK